MGNDNTGLQQFDPFNDRMSRDIRNSLSEAFVDALVSRNPASFEEAARTWLRCLEAGIYKQYIEERLGLYRRVFEIIEQERLREPLALGLAVWNQGLFFEFHDHLERIWRKTTGEMHQALKGLIRAAGVYIHLHYHRPQAADRLARKSLDLLRSHCDCLRDLCNLDELMAALDRGDPEPPKLKRAESIHECS